jgi:hypothetical protein
LLAAAALALAISPAQAWSDLGHMTIATAAWDLLTPPARAEADRLMRLHPSFADWTRDAVKGGEGRIAFVHAATWPDDIKKDPAYSDGPVGEDGAAANLGFSDHRRHRYWHTAGFPWSTDGTPGVEPREPNALERLRLFRRSLAAANAPDEVKAYDLAWTIHLVGDVHQPAHTTTRFSKLFPHGDHVATKVLVTIGDKQKTLHAYWDDLLGGRGTPEKAIAAAASKPALRGLVAAPATDLDPAVWFVEGGALARRWIYTAEIGDGPGPFALGDDHRRAAPKIADERAAVAAARLAGLLNEAFAGK